MTSFTQAVPREIPAFECQEMQPKSAAYCIAVFVINENGRLLRFLEKLRPFASQIDIVIADGGSTDRSTELEGLRARDVNTLLVKRGPGKLGAQMRMAFAWALERGYRGVVTIDGNDKDDPGALVRFIELLDQGYDHVQGSRFVPGGISENLPLSRWLGVKLLHAPLVRWASRFPYTDTTNGFRGYSAALLSDPRVAVFRSVFVGYELHYYLAIRAARLGFKVCETPVARRYPAKGPPPTKISFLRGNLRVVRCLFSACLGRYNPSSDGTRDGK
jgi:glycosyltransferase involved in cell wall biosynthesis